MSRHRRDAGGASLEVVIIAPFLLLIFMLVLAFARFAQAESIVDQAARDGARAATAQNSKSQVDSVAGSAAEQTLDDAPASCQHSASAHPQMSDNAFEPIPPESEGFASVTVTVTCVIDMSDLAGLPLGSVTVSRTFTSPVDRYRGFVE